MKTARTKINVFKGTLTMEFDGEVIDFNLSESIKFPKEDHSCFSIDIIDDLAQEFFDSLGNDTLETTIAQGIGQTAGLAVPRNVEEAEIVAALESLPQHHGKPSNPISISISTNRLLPSLVQEPNRYKGGGSSYMDCRNRSTTIREDHYPLPFSEPYYEKFQEVYRGGHTPPCRGP